jgi:tyrosyl-tRNA synthetase
VAVRSDVELGGTDQMFNLLLGRDVQQSYGVPPQVAVTMPILPGTDGVKRMAKSEGNYIGVDEPAEEMFGKTMSVPDAVMPLYYDLLLDRPLDSSQPPVEAKRTLARELTARFAGEDAAAAAEEHFDRLHVSHEMPDEIEDAVLPGENPIHLPALIADAFGISRSEARRLLTQGAVRLDGTEVLSEADLDVPAERLDGRVIQVGKRRFKRFRRPG